MRTAVMKRLGKTKEDQKGFTLIELLAVIVILAVIAAIAIPLIGGIINKSKKDSDVATARQIYDAARLYITSEMGGDATGGGKGIVLPVKHADSGSWASHGLMQDGYLDNKIVLPSSKLEITGGEVVFSTTGELLYVHIITGSDNTYVAGANVIASEGKATSSAPAAAPTDPATPKP